MVITYQIKIVIDNTINAPQQMGLVRFVLNIYVLPTKSLMILANNVQMCLIAQHMIKQHMSVQCAKLAVQKIIFVLIFNYNSV